MYEFNNKEIDFLRRLGKSGNGRELTELLTKIKINVDSTSNIPDGSDFESEAKGRKVAVKFINKLLDAIKNKKESDFVNMDDEDDFA